MDESMKAFRCALKLEQLLKRASSSAPLQGEIRCDPYDAIENVLLILRANGSKVPGAIEEFEYQYQTFRGKSLDQLIDENESVEKMIHDLEYIIKNS